MRRDGWVGAAVERGGLLRLRRCVAFYGSRAWVGLATLLLKVLGGCEIWQEQRSGNDGCAHKSARDLRAMGPGCWVARHDSGDCCNVLTGLA